jgi:TolA-binding protein
MKIMKTKIFLLILIASFVAHADNKLDGDTDGLVIDRLERALEDMDKTDDSRWEIMIRAADLRAERARISEMNTIAKELGAASPVGPCETCKAAKEDRRRAIELYKDVFENGKIEDKGRVILQMAHLSQLNGDEKKAESLFNKILKSGKYGEDVTAESHSGLAEILYRQTKFKAAIAHFEKALANKNIQKRGQLTYRLAWCQLNLGNLKSAKANLEVILKNPDLMSFNVGDQRKLDTAFQEEVSRDYATFLARGEITDADITNLLNLSPEANRSNNLYHLANELDRLGKKKMSLIAWRFANSRQTDPNEKLEGFVKMAQVHYDIGNKGLAAEEIQKASDHWKSEGCKEDQNCEELQHKMRKLITDWDRASKKVPSADLLKAYGAYLAIWPQETEMVYWSANLAKRLNKHQEATALFRKATSLAKSDLKSAKGSEEQKKLKNIFEGSLLSEIESAELAKNHELRLDAYKNYLNQNPDGEKAHEVRYQIVHITYEKGDYKKAADGFRELVNDNKFPQPLKIQAADLALDSLNLAKESDKLEKWSLEFAERVPERRKEFTEISRKAALNKVAVNVSQKDASESDLRSSLNKMNAVPLSGMTKDQKVLYLKDKITIARRIKDIDQVRRAAEELSSITKFSTADNVFARQQLLWVAENTLDFKNAYRIAKVTDIPGKSDIEMELQLGIYADLGGMNPVPHYERYIHSTQNRKSARQVMVSVIKKSKNPSHTFRKYESELASEPSLYAPLALEDYGRSGNLTLARQRLARPGLRSTPEAFIVYRQQALGEFNRNSKTLMFHRLNRSSDRALKRTLTERVSLLRNSENRAQAAVQSRDWTLQIVHLDYLASEYSRLYRDILTLPVPRGLNKVQREQYRGLLKSQSEPYRQKAQQFEQKVTDLWNQSDIRENLLIDYSKASGSLRKLVNHELQTLIRIAPVKYKSDLRLAMQSRSEARVDSNVLQKALSNVKRDPFDTDSLEKLKELEKKAGRHAMVAFLEAKVDQLKKGERQ